MEILNIDQLWNKPKKMAILGYLYELTHERWRRDIYSRTLAVRTPHDARCLDSIHFLIFFPLLFNSSKSSLIEDM